MKHKRHKSKNIETHKNMQNSSIKTKTYKAYWAVWWNVADRTTAESCSLRY